MKIELKHVKKSYYFNDSETNIFKSLDLAINECEIVAFIGPNGCGKSTLFNIISKIDTNYSGEINIKNSSDFAIAYMFQNDLLMPWKTVMDNTLIGIEIQGKLNNDLKELALKFLQLFGLGKQIKQYPISLSGGERRKIALVRTILTNPDILLLDEPFSAIDYQSRLELQCWFYSFFKDNFKTVLLITHDIEEAISLSDRIVVLNNKPNGIINEISIDLNVKERNPLNLRQDPKFTLYFQQVWDILPKAFIKYEKIT